MPVITAELRQNWKNNKENIFLRQLLLFFLWLDIAQEEHTPQLCYGNQNMLYKLAH